MASATSMQQRRLREFLKEQQEPFTLSNYLSERGCSRTRSLQRSAGSCLNMKAKLVFSRVVTSLCKKLASQHNQSGSVIVDERPAVRDEDLGVVREAPIIGEIVMETEWFSSSSSSTLFYSCSEIDEDDISFSSHTLQASNLCPTGMQSQQSTKNGKHRWRCKVPSRRASASRNEMAVNEDARKTEKKVHSCIVPLTKKRREESISSTAIWGLLMQSVKKERSPRKLRDNVAAASVSQGLKSTRVLQKTKQLIFYCARERLPRKGKGEQCHRMRKEVGKFICERTSRSWGQRSRYGGIGRGQSCLFSLDDSNSVYEWSDLEAQVEDVILQIGDAILECIINQIVSEFI